MGKASARDNCSPAIPLAKAHSRTEHRNREQVTAGREKYKGEHIRPGRNFRVDIPKKLRGSTYWSQEFVNNKHVGHPYCWAEMYAGRVAYCPSWVTVSMPTGQTDGRQTVTLCFPLCTRSQCNKQNTVQYWVGVSCRVTQIVFINQTRCTARVITSSVGGGNTNRNTGCRAGHLVSFFERTLIYCIVSYLIVHFPIQCVRFSVAARTWRKSNHGRDGGTSLLRIWSRGR